MINTCLVIISPLAYQSMKTLAALIIGAVLGVAATQVQNTAAPSPAPTPPAASSSAPAAGSAAAAAPAQGTGNIVHPISKNITERLTKSTRHVDIVKIKQGDREIETQIVYPLNKNKAMVVIMIHEIFGVSDWMRAAADQMAEAGYIAVVPDLLSGTGPNKGGTLDIPISQVTTSVQRLPAPQVTADLTAVVDYAKKLEACDGNVVVSGFCWGGGKSFALATVNHDIKAAFVFYGAAPAVADMAKITVPVYGFYGGNDRNLAAAVPGTEAAMKAAGKTYEAVVYEGAAHGFMRSGQMDEASAADKKAAEEAWKRWLDLLKKIDAPADAKPAAAASTAK